MATKKGRTLKIIFKTFDREGITEKHNGLLKLKIKAVYIYNNIAKTKGAVKLTAPEIASIIYNILGVNCNLELISIRRMRICGGGEEGELRELSQYLTEKEKTIIRLY